MFIKHHNKVSQKLHFEQNIASIRNFVSLYVSFTPPPSVNIYEHRNSFYHILQASKKKICEVFCFLISSNSQILMQFLNPRYYII